MVCYFIFVCVTVRTENKYQCLPLLRPFTSFNDCAASLFTIKLNQGELMAEWEIIHGIMRVLVQFSERRKGNSCGHTTDFLPR